MPVDVHEIRDPIHVFVPVPRCRVTWPFSHASEELLPNGWDHETITRRIICSDEMRTVWDSITPPLRHEDIEKLAVGPKKASELSFSDWEAILSEIIVGDAFGVDRMDYLLRDSYHVGVAYGRFDHYRLVDTLRILPSSQSDEREDSQEPSLGVKMGGIQSAEAMMLARYLMYSQVYFHPKISDSDPEGRKKSS